MPIINYIPSLICESFLCHLQIVEMSLSFANEYVSCSVEVHTDDNTITIHGNVKAPEDYNKMVLIAAHPIDRMISYSGSGLPWPCPEFAFEDTPNYVEIQSNGIIFAKFKYPNSYYLHNAIDKIPPSLFLRLSKDGMDPIVIRMEIPQDPMLNMRSLTHRMRRHNEGPLFYNTHDYMNPIPSSSEAVMRTLKDYKLKYDIAQ